MKASELIGSRVLVLGSAAICGTVGGIVPSADCKKIKALEVLMDDEDDCEKKYLDVSRITAVSRGTVTVKYAESLVMCYPVGAVSPINLPAFGEDGEDYGKVTDLDLGEKFAIESLYCGKRIFSLGEVLSRSDDLIVFRLPGSKTKIARKKKKVPAPAARTADEKKKTDNVVRITGTRRYSFIVGRTLGEDVSDLEGRLIAAKGALVTSELIDRAKDRGAVVKLVMSAL